MELSRASVVRNDRSWRARQMHAFPMLTPEVEQELARRWRDRHDIAAAHQLVCSHLRLVVKIANGYRGYGLPSDDLIGEGHLGLMRAVCKFDPDRGVRFSSYALWWVRAAICQYILHNWSLVKIGTTGAQKKLFFNLRRTQRHLQIAGEGALTPEHASSISKTLQVRENEVVCMDQRMAGPDLSLNVRWDKDGQSEWQTQLADDGAGQETVLAEREEATERTSLLHSALSRLTTRERDILVARHLREVPVTLTDLSQHYGVSKERVRQIELRAIDKLRRSVLGAPDRSAGATQGLLLRHARPCKTRLPIASHDASRDRCTVRSQGAPSDPASSP